MLDFKGWHAAALTTAILFAAPAQAATYQYTSGFATITASSPGGVIGTATLTLNGVFAEFDTSTGLLTDFHFTTSPNQLITLNTVYGGFDEIWVNSASVTPGVGYFTESTTQGPPGHWNIRVRSIAVDAFYTGRNSITNDVVGPINLPYVNDVLLGQIDASTGSFLLQGITLGVVPVPEGPVIVGAVITFNAATAVPEPATVSLLALAGLALAFARSRAQCA